MSVYVAVGSAVFKADNLKGDGRAPAPLYMTGGYSAAEHLALQLNGLQEDRRARSVAEGERDKARNEAEFLKVANKQMDRDSTELRHRLSAVSIERDTFRGYLRENSDSLTKLTRERDEHKRRADRLERERNDARQAAGNLRGKNHTLGRLNQKLQTELNKVASQTSNTTGFDFTVPDRRGHNGYADVIHSLEERVARQQKIIDKAHAAFKSLSGHADAHRRTFDKVEP